ncbi:MAG: ester cyclase [Caldilineaceae bacterium]|nr:ester cyclase [Caldilineaceae bacterium]MBP8110512.1 ester cyclase [Caldilineaceae bacterium]MBP8122708.1 ester cyclase [Caldilineaceae bacterium]MBP9072178.1 ester cyclase [Caldilineaceae bacterium]
MYGTIAQMRTQPGKTEDLRALAANMETAPGQLARFVFQTDADEQTLFVVAVFDSRSSYWENASSPAQHQRYLAMRALLADEPAWHDGEIIDAAFTDANTAVVLRSFSEVINQENKEVIAQIYAPDVWVHDPFMGTAQGIDVFNQLLGMFDTAFPHHRVTVDQVVSQGDMVCVLHTHTATHTGPFMGMPATGKTAVVNGLELFRLRDGKIVEFWRKDDDVSLLMQLGMLPMPQPA